MSDHIDVSGDTQGAIAKAVNIIQGFDLMFQDLAEDCENYNHGGCLAHGDNCTSLACPLGKEE